MMLNLIFKEIINMQWQVHWAKFWLELEVDVKTGITDGERTHEKRNFIN